MPGAGRHRPPPDGFRQTSRRKGTAIAEITTIEDVALACSQALDTTRQSAPDAVRPAHFEPALRKIGLEADLAVESTGGMNWRAPSKWFEPLAA